MIGRYERNNLSNPPAQRAGVSQDAVQAQGRAHNGKKFKESCETVVVNAHGGLLMLKHEIDNGEMLVLTNPETLEEQECRVVYQGEPCERGQRIGVEFLTPAPHFWGLEFGELSGLIAGRVQQPFISLHGRGKPRLSKNLRIEKYSDLFSFAY